MKLFLIALGTMAIVSGVSAQTVPQMTVAAKRLIADRVIDPSSLQYRKLRLVPGKIETSNGPMLCGQYNSKNRMGGYVGFKDFIYDPRKKMVVTLGGNFFSDVDGDFSLDEFSKQKMTPDTDFKARLADLKAWSDRYQSYLMQCA
jgi:hypothetical protein